MSINEISKTNNNKNSCYKKAAVHGALGTTALLGVSTAIDVFLKPERTKTVIEKFGGPNKYLKNLAVTVAIFAAVGAAANTLTTHIINKVANKKNN